jgi:hypothetical protein
MNKIVIIQPLQSSAYPDNSNLNSQEKILIQKEFTINYF